MNRISALLAVALLCVISPEADATSRDEGFAKAMAIYAQRAEVTKHVEAVSAFSELAKAHPTDREVQFWCARTASYAAHRIFDTKVKQKIAGRGVKCAQRMLDADPTDYDGRLWWILCRRCFLESRRCVTGLWGSWCL